MHGDIYKEFGIRLSNLRKSKKMTQAEVAEKLSTVQSTYSGYELGTRKVTLEIIKALAIIFEVSPDYLILGDSYEYEYSNEDYKMDLDERQLLLNYRQLSDEGKESIQKQMILHLNTYKKNYIDADMEASEETA